MKKVKTIGDMAKLARPERIEEVARLFARCWIDLRQLLLRKRPCI